MMEPALAAICGLYCGDCDLLGKQCDGCGNIDGKPIWTESAKMDVCPLYGCCVGSKKLEHCGLCDEFPCDLFRTIRDPAFTNEEFEQSLQDRIEVLRLRKEMGTEAWCEETR